MDPSISASRCTAMPTLGPAAMRLVEAVDRGDTYVQMFYLVIDMARELRQQSIDCNEIVKNFEEIHTVENERLRLLFHTLHRRTLRSLVLGHIAYDLHDKDSPNWANVYNDECAGSYLIGISIDGRQGAFLNQREIKSVIEVVEEYREGCEAWGSDDIDDSYDQSQMDPAKRAATERALLIDNEMESASHKWRQGQKLTQPKFSNGRKGVSNVDELAEMLRRRVDARFDEDTYQTSSPSYVGCAHGLPVLSAMYDPDCGGPTSSSQVLRLLLACIRHVGLEPLVHRAPMAMVWEEEMIGPAEVLVTVLSQSLITLDGLNVVKPGTATSSGNENLNLYKRTKEHVFARRDWFGQNIDASQEWLQGTDILREMLTTLDTEYPPLDEMGRRIEDIKLQVAAIGPMQEELRKAEEEAARKIREGQELNDRMESLINEMAGIFPDPPDDNEAQGREHVDMMDEGEE
ncbi:hypothetical protein GGR52DRAFT_552863 [Hypoxylon sp. FL1284]|nr:hypothetical protein GGR52DRAFT_552863 [Hypoxylon sp. FL1284]